MNPFPRLVNTQAGRIVRIVAGVALIAIGMLAMGGLAGIVVAALGVVPLAAGVFDFCLLAPIFRVPWSGAKIRAMK